ncbi:hypothetical protein AHMF7616_00455 [Adhaeribacter pallidiroseus]|uniref:Uncharacterized protein n=1 Tax=Adhaeribacter pallidiroseus TaxID=2072847 RepID=A0A369QF74_9BACT|nr:hypothetical protein AHMF7616_00455 [Adhaeribacter pallidiroseus]
MLAALKSKTNLWRLPTVLDYFKISTRDRSLKVLVDQALIHAQLFLADVTLIERIEVTKQEAFAPYRYSFNPDERYLNIVTR